MLTKALAIDHAPDNIRVYCVCPCNVDTPLPSAGVAPGGGFEGAAKNMGELAKPEDVACLAFYLASDESSYVNHISFLSTFRMRTAASIFVVRIVE